VSGVSILYLWQNDPGAAIVTLFVTPKRHPGSATVMFNAGMKLIYCLNEPSLTIYKKEK
jgi:hypothetical protein